MHLLFHELSIRLHVRSRGTVTQNRKYCINRIVFCIVFNDDEAVETVHDCQSTESTRLTSLGHCFSNIFHFSVEEPLK